MINIEHAKHSATNQWMRMVNKLLSYGAKASPRGFDTVELLGYQSVVDMNSPVVEFKERNLGKSFLPGEAWWILSGKSDVKSIAQYTKAIAKFSDNGVSFFGAYGPKIMEQLDYIVETLERDSESRQAVINIWRECPPKTKDVPCTLSAQFIIRDRKIHCNLTMRSSDAWLGWPYDVFNFSMLSMYVAMKINARAVFQGTNYRAYGVNALGNLTLTAGSQHFYLKDLTSELVEVLKEAPPYPQVQASLEYYGCINHKQLLIDLKDHADNHDKPKTWLSPYYA